MISSVSDSVSPSTKRLGVFTADSPNLDCLRAYAVCLVLFYHLLLALNPNARGIAFMGMFGVLIFFVHTSLVLMLSMDRMVEKGHKLFLSFYIRRAFRIYPLSIFTVACSLLFGYRTLSRVDAVSNFALTMNLTMSEFAIDPLWSLPYEVQMYVFLPLVYLFVKKYPSPWATGAVLVASFFMALVQPSIDVRADLAQYVGCFLPGIIAYQLSFRFRRQWHPLLWPVVLLAGTVIFGAVRYFQLQPAFLYRWLACLLVGLAAPHFRQMADGPVRHAAHLIAKYSYGIYLMHMFALHIAFVTLSGHSAAIRWAGFLAMMIVFPVGVFHLIEQPGIQVGKRVVSWAVQGKR
jgi:peptidoglycan/LPS O-acetylase OafA/YrhL